MNDFLDGLDTDNGIGITSTRMGPGAWPGSAGVSASNPLPGGSTPRLDPFAPDLPMGPDGDGTNGDGAGEDGPAFTPADVPFAMMRDAERWVRRHPVASALALLGAGVALGATVYEMLRPRSSEEERMRRILAELDEAIGSLREELEGEEG